MTIMARGVAEGWHADKIWVELSKTKAFQRRFGSFAAVSEAMGVTNPLTVVNEILEMESGIREAYHNARSPGSDPSDKYIQKLLATGWSVAEIDDLLQAEQRVRNTPGALHNLNRILNYLGLPELHPKQLVQVMTGTAPAQMMEAVNDALRQSALAEQGITIGAAFAESLGDGSGGSLQSPEYLKAIANQAARNILRFGLEIDAGKFGISKKDILSAAFDDERSGEVDEKLEKFARERASFGKGLAGPQGFVDAAGRLKLQGLQDL